MQLTLQFQSLSYPHGERNIELASETLCERRTNETINTIIKSDINLPNVISNVGTFSEKLKNGPCQNKDRQEGISCHHREVLHKVDT